MFSCMSSIASDFKVREVAAYPSSAGASATTTTAKAINDASPRPTVIDFYNAG